MKTNKINVVLSLNKSGRFGDLGDGNDLVGIKGSNLENGNGYRRKVSEPASPPGKSQ